MGFLEFFKKLAGDTSIGTADMRFAHRVVEATGEAGLDALMTAYRREYYAVLYRAINEQNRFRRFRDDFRHQIQSELESLREIYEAEHNGMFDYTQRTLTAFYEAASLIPNIDIIPVKWNTLYASRWFNNEWFRNQRNEHGNSIFLLFSERIRMMQQSRNWREMNQEHIAYAANLFNSGYDEWVSFQLRRDLEYIQPYLQ